jgi:hypothetical protein
LSGALISAASEAGEQPVGGLAQDADGLVVARVGDPQVGVLDRAPGERGGQKQRGDHLLALGIEECVGVRRWVGVGGGEDVGGVAVLTSSLT